MKPSFYIALFSLLLFTPACQPDQMEDENNEPADLVGTWQLTEIVWPSMIAGKPAQISKPAIEEFYHFYSNNTFKRTRANGYEATGTYTNKDVAPNEPAIALTFDSKELCYNEAFDIKFNHPQETFIRITDSSFSQSYIAGDGPTFRYEKILRVD